jgi:hypothetical protein
MQTPVEMKTVARMFCFVSSKGNATRFTCYTFYEYNYAYNLTLTNKGTGKVVPVLFPNWAPHHEGVLGEQRYVSTHSLTSALDWGEWSASRTGRFTLRKRAPGAHWIGDWVGSRAVLDAVVKRKIPSPRKESNPRTPIVQHVAQHYTDWAILLINKALVIIRGFLT